MIIFDDYSDGIPFEDNFFSLTVGLMIVLFFSLIMFAFDFERELWFQPFKTLAVLAFLGCASYYYYTLVPTLSLASLGTIPVATLNIGFATGVMTYSFCQSATIPFIIANQKPE